MRGYSDHTATTAVGSANREWKALARLALRMRSGNVSYEWIEANESKFTGIYKRLLEDPIEDVQKYAYGRSNNY